MRPDQLRCLLSEEEQEAVMERCILAVRHLWFGAQVVPLGIATCLIEAGGEILMLVNGDSDSVDHLVQRALRRKAYVVETSFSRPRDLARRLQQAGFRPVLRQAVCVWQGTAGVEPDEQHVPSAPRLLRLFHRDLPPVTVRRISPDELPKWNSVCWQAFGHRGCEEAALLEKERGYFGMGEAGRWYLAFVGERPVGTAILYQGVEAAQIMAVGTLPGWRRRGVATAVLNCLIQEWENAGRGLLFLGTTPDSAAERLYHHLGFRRAYCREVYAPFSG